MDYQELEQDLDALLVAREVINKAEQECKVLSEGGEAIDRSMRMRKWFAQMIQHDEDDARNFIDWYTKRLPERLEQHQEQIEDEQTPIQRLAQYFTNGSS